MSPVFLYLELSSIKKVISSTSLQQFFSDEKPDAALLVDYSATGCFSFPRAQILGSIKSNMELLKSRLIDSFYGFSTLCKVKEILRF